MSKVIYCPIYNEICGRDWCMENQGTCGWSGHSQSQVVSPERAKELISEGIAEGHKKRIKAAIKLLEGAGYKITKPK